MRRLLLYLAVAAAAAGLVHIGISLAVAGRVATQQQRMFNLRLVPTETWPDLAAGYIESQQPAPILVVGSSFSFGYPYPPGNAFPALLEQQAGQRVVNASIIGAGLDGLRSMILCGLPDRSVEKLVVEVPLINETSNIVRGGLGSAKCPPSEPQSLLRFVIRHAWAFGWLPLLSDEYATAADQPEIAVNKIADGYFATAEQFGDNARAELRDRIENGWAHAKRAAEQAYLLVTPVYLPGVTEGGADANAVEAQFQFALSVCRELAGPHCIDTPPLLTEREAWSNITHLNRHGGERLAEITGEVFSLTTP